MSYFLGIDIGSRTSKAVLMRDADAVAHGIILTGTDYGLAAERLRAAVLENAGLASQRVTRTVATGNSGSVRFCDEEVSGIVCCARGIGHEFPSIRTVIDIQAQSSTVIRLDGKGRVMNFVVSEKCAAGSGFFLDIIANVLRVDISEVGPLSLRSTKPIAFSTACAVFGESEAISRVAEGESKEDILAGVHVCLAEKISGLVGRVGMERECAVSGGGALDIGLIKSLEERLSVSLLIPRHPQLVAALGAAIMARERSNVE